MEPVTAPELWPTLMKSIGMLCVVLGMLVLFLFLIKRLSGVRGAGSGRGLIKVLETCSVAPREQVMLLEVMGEKVLIGVTARNINFLTRIDRDGAFDMPDPPEKKSFMEALGAAVKKREGGV